MSNKWLLFWLLLACCGACTAQSQPVDYVNPMIGTGFHGHTYPGATVPFGAVQLSPDNYKWEWDACSGYHYDRDSLYGFSHTHLSGTGGADLADILFRPTVLPSVPFSHDKEQASAGYYAVLMPSLGVKAELTATTHTGWHRYTYPSGDTDSLVIDLGHIIAPEQITEATCVQTAPNQVSGMRLTQGWVPNHAVYFVARFSRDIKTATTIENNQMVLTFAHDASPLVAKVGLSLTDEAHATANLDSETPTSPFDFDAVRTKARDEWNNLLSKIQVTGGTEAQKNTFYTALYHTAIVPNCTSDADTQEPFKTYSTLSFWDTFRSWLPLATLLYPQVLHDIAFTSLAFYDATGELPIWPLALGETNCMIGYHSVPFLVAAYRSGLVPDMDVEKALEAMVTSSNHNAKGSVYYIKYGFIPADKARESVSCALEYAYDDWVIAQFAGMIGKTQVQETYKERAMNYVRLFEGGTAFFRGKNSDYSWVEPFDAMKSAAEYTEATPWQYRFFVPHDFYGLSQLFGGDASVAAALDSLFSVTKQGKHDVLDITGLIGEYAHGNEPSHHIAYAYNYVGQPWKTQAMTRRILQELYDDTPAGLCGNEDCGQMSAWYVLSALGLYEVCPGTGQFNLTTPLFSQATLSLPSGKTLTILANQPDVNTYIDAVTWNGQVVSANYITYDQLMQGGVLQFTLTDKPNTQRGTRPEDKPYSATEAPFVSTPYYNTNGVFPDMFLNDVTVALQCRTAGAQIRYTTDGSMPNAHSALYQTPLSFSDNAEVCAIAFKEGCKPSYPMRLFLTKAHIQPAQGKPNTQQGVSYTYFTGPFTKVDDMMEIGRFADQGLLDEPSLEPAKQEDHFGFLFAGTIYIPEGGLWRFATRSDDGSTLTIGNQLVVNNDGSHSAKYREGKIYLEKGYYPYILKYIDDTEEQEFQWFWQAPSASSPVAIPKEVLYL